MVKKECFSEKKNVFIFLKSFSTKKNWKAQNMPMVAAVINADIL